jgi:DHA2 family multidrug resistance protein-like MFS transporter
MSHGLPLPRRYWAILAISFGNALTTTDGSIVNVALPTIAHDLHVENSAVVLLVTTYQLIMVMTLLPLANLGDRIGHRRLYQTGLLIFTAGAMLAFFARSLPFLIIVRSVQAVGAAASLSVSSAMLRTIYPAAQLGRGLGINSVVVSCSAAVAPTVGGLILTFAHWPWIFAAAVPFGLISLAFGRALPDPEPHDKPFDFLGAALCAASFGLVISGAQSAVQGDSPVISAAIIVTGLVIGYYFVRRELHEPRPILPVDLLAQPTFALSALAGFIAFAATVTFTLWLPFHLQHSYGFTPPQVGAVLAPWPLTFAIISPLSGALSDRIPAGLLGAIGLTVAAGALLLIAMLPAHPGYFDIVWRIVLLGVGFGFFFSPNNRLIIGSAPIERSAAAGGIITTARSFGQTSGATLVSVLLATSLGATAAPALVAAGLAIAGAICSAIRLRPALRMPAFEEVEEF